MEWHDGKPPDFGNIKVWILIEVPAHITHSHILQAVLWNRDGGYMSKEVNRALRWAVIPWEGEKEQEETGEYTQLSAFGEEKEEME